LDSHDGPRFAGREKDRPEWYRAKGRLRGTLVGCIGLSIFFVAILWYESLPPIVARIHVAVGFAIAFMGWRISAYDVWSGWRTDGADRRAWIARHGDADRRDDPADR